MSAAELPGDQEIDALYERYAKPLEAAEHSKFIAVMPDGRYVLADTITAVMEEADMHLGPGSTIFQIGPRAALGFR